MRIRKFILLLIFLIIVSGIVFKYRGDRLHRPGKPDVFTVEGDDPEMNAAIEKARATIGIFTKYLSDSKFSKADFGIKVRYDEDGRSEHIWVDNVTFDGKLFHGTVGNDPVHLKRLPLGAYVDASIDDISDWMIYDGNSIIGGYTIRVLQGRMSPEERDPFENVEFKDR